MGSRLAALAMALAIAGSMPACSRRYGSMGTLAGYRGLQTRGDGVHAAALRPYVAVRVVKPVRVSFGVEPGVTNAPDFLLAGHLGIDYDLGHHFRLGDGTQPYPTDSPLVLRLGASLTGLTILATNERPHWDASTVLRFGPTFSLEAGWRQSADVAWFGHFSWTMIQLDTDRVVSAFFVGLGLEWDACRGGSPC